MTLFRNILLSLVAAAILVVGGWGIWRWATYPVKPDVAHVDVNESIAFIGTNDFNRLFESDRKKYVLAVIDRLHEKSFPELIALGTFNESHHREAAANVRSLEGREEIEGAMLRLILDKFYEQSPAVRSVYLSGLVMMDQAARSKGRSGAIPTPDRLRKDMAKIIGRQSPQTVARFGQFLVDVEQHRRQMGYGASY